MIKAQNGIEVPKILMKMDCIMLDPSLFQPIKNAPLRNKPAHRTGLWTSPYYPNSEFISAWHEWCYYNQPDWIVEDIVEITLKDTAKVYCIDTVADVKVLLNVYGDCQVHPEFYSFCCPNFEEIAEIYDAIYLTNNGEHVTRFPADRHYTLYGWDCESVLILKWDCIESWRYIKLSNIKKEEPNHQDTSYDAMADYERSITNEDDDNTGSI